MFSWLTEPPAPPAPLTLKLEVHEGRIFTAFERIAGRLVITPRADTAFDDLRIKLLGTSRTYGRRVVPQAPNARTVTTAHRFLELTQPEVVSGFPADRVFRSGQTYEFPFEFAIPDRMLPATCRHAVRSLRVHQNHTSMPPSFGDQDHSRAVDYAPRNLSVTYRVIAEATSIGSPDECPSSGLIASASKRIRFVPTRAPSILASDSWTEVRPIREEVALKRVWTRPAGRIAITSVKCTPFSVREPESEIWNSHMSGQLRVNLAFFPDCNNTKPPGHVKVNGILRSETISAVRPIPQLPSDQEWDGPELDKHAAPAVILSSQAVDRIIWSQHSKCGTISSDDALPCYDTLPPNKAPQSPCHRSYYSTEIVISLGAAIRFFMVPSFDSCLVSRNYSVELKLSMQGSAIGSISAVRFTVPVQVAVEPSISRQNSLGSVGELDEDMLSRGTNPLDLPPCYECRI